MFPTTAGRLLSLLALVAVVGACSGAETGGSAATATAGAAASPSITRSPSAVPTSAPAASSSGGTASAAPGTAIHLTDGGLALVEPLPDLSAGEGSVTINTAGSLAAVEAGQDLVLHGLACATACANPATWSRTPLDPGVPFDYPLVRARDNGGLVAVVDSFVAGQLGDYLGFCDQACDAASSWRWIRLGLPAGSTTQRAASRYLATSGDAMILGLGAGSPMSALVCATACDQPASWVRVKFSSSVCTAPSVAAGPGGAMAFACATSDEHVSPPGSVEVWTCPSRCAEQASWAGVKGVAAGDGLATDVAIGPGGGVGVAVNLGKQADPGRANRLAWFSCSGTCGEPTSWHGIVIGTETLYARRVAAVTDAQGRTVIAYDGSSSAGNGLLVAACGSVCTSAASWTVALLDDAKRLASTVPVTPPAGCDAATWMPDNVVDITMRGDWVAVASGYSAIGTGGTCTNSLVSPGAAYRPLRSVVSIAIVGPTP